MRVDGYPAVLVPDRLARPDVTDAYAAAQRQQQDQRLAQQPEQISASLRTDTPQAVMQITSDSVALQQYQQRQALPDTNLPHHVSQTLASYQQTYQHGQEQQPGAAQVLGLDFYV